MTIAESLFKQYCQECGMDEECVKATTWYAAGMVDFAEWLLSQKLDNANVSSSADDEFRRIEQAFAKVGHTIQVLGRLE